MPVAAAQPCLRGAVSLSARACLIRITRCPTWLLVVARVTGKASAWIRRPAVRRALDQAAGAVLIAVGLNNAAVARPHCDSWTGTPPVPRFGAAHPPVILTP